MFWQSSIRFAVRRSLPRLGSTQLMLLVGAIAILILSGAGYFAVLKPQQQAVGALQAKTGQLTQERTRLSAQIAEMRAASPRRPGGHSHTHGGGVEAHTHPAEIPAQLLTGKILDTETKLGARAFQLEAMQAVLNMARATGIQQVSYQRTQSGVGPPLSTAVTVARQRDGESRHDEDILRAQTILNLVATWRQLIVFLAALDDIDYPVAVNGMQLSRSSDGDVRARVTLITYISQRAR